MTDTALLICIYHDPLSMLIINMGNLIPEISFLLNVQFLVSTKYALIQVHLECQPYKALKHNCAVTVYQCTTLQQLGDTVQMA